MTTTYLAYIPSPSQGVWHLGPVPIRAYALFIILGIVVALVLGQRRWEARSGARDGVTSDPDDGAVVYDIALWAVPFGLVGGRLYHVMTDWRTYFGDGGAGIAGAFRIWDGGLGIWGAVALGGVGAWIGCRRRGIPLPAFGDAIAPGIILAQAIGRLGNYFNQELYGRPTTLPWGLEIYERRDAAGALDTLNGVSTGQLIEVVHPTFLYELLWNLLVFAALIYIDRRFKIGHGRLFAMYVAGYCLGRFWVELMRSDAATHIAGFRINSFTSAFVFVGAVVYIMVAPKGREDPASLAGKPKAAEEVEDEVETFAKELTAVAATTGVVAAAKAAGEADDEDAKAAADDASDEKADVPEASEASEASEVSDQPEVEDAEALGADVAGVPAETLEEAEEFAAEGDDVPEAVADEAAAEQESAETKEPEAETAESDQAETEHEEPPQPEAETAESDQSETEHEEPPQPEAETAESDQSEAVHEEPPQPEAETAESDQAEAVHEEPPQPEAETAESDQVEAEHEEPPQPEAETAESDQAEAEHEEPQQPEAETAESDQVETAVADEVPGERDEPSSEAAAEAEALAEDVAEAPAADIAEAEEFAEAGEEAERAEAAAQSDDAEPDEPETEDAEAAVGEAEAEPSEEEAAEQAEAVVEEAGAAADGEPKTGVLEAAKVEATVEAPRPAEQTGGRLSRWLRRNR